ncbi:class I SAM-dependent methyltransferase [Thiomicrospira microaerophila]|uniref:class I SAM-dependent methyltransferase n=1 Tax=Thiomicrospira microaerophila TaxID=406020 RepID=UPI00200D0A36|nr:class I SAM-dependent methyltransferase [Thiomicrospira microaerophila]UQB42494.1 class I SAM-dependent methyltransferase [Thiomicrospira microaerophila]
MEKTQQQILRHHGGDGEHARKMISQTYADRHDEDFWHFWQTQMAPVIGANEGLMDLGAGTGLFVQALAQGYPNASIIGIEAAPYMLNAVVDLPSHARVVADDLNDPSEQVEAGSVAAIMCNMLVHELIQPVLMFQAAYRWLKPGGRFCVIDLVRQPLESYLARKYPNAELSNANLTREQLEDAFEHFLEHNRYHAQDIVYMLQACGFEVIEQTPLKNGRMIRLVAQKPR